MEGLPPCLGWLLTSLPEPGIVGLVIHVSLDASFAAIAALALDPSSVKAPITRSMLATIDMVWYAKIFSLAISAVAVEPVVPTCYGTLGTVLNSIFQIEAPAEPRVLFAGVSAESGGSCIVHEAHCDAIFVIDGREALDRVERLLI